MTSLYDEIPHGTAVASMAVGVTLGVAKNATFIAVKFRSNRGSFPEWIVECWNWIVDDVIEKGRQGKAVIVYAYSKPPLGLCSACVNILPAQKWTGLINRNGHVNYGFWNIPSPRRSDYFLPLLADAWTQNIHTIFPSGNVPSEHLGDISPQRYGRETNAIITVGALDPEGRRSPFNTLEGPGSLGQDPSLIGSITVFAQGDHVKVAQPYGDSDYEYKYGSSLAAPQVAGLAAYLQGLPGSVTTLSPMDMKRQIISLSRGSDAAGSPGLIYNGVREAVCPDTIMSRRELKELSVREKVASRRQLLTPGRQRGPPILFSSGQFQSPEIIDLVSPHVRNDVLVSLLTPVRGLVHMPEATWILG